MNSKRIRFIKSSLINLILLLLPLIFLSGISDKKDSFLSEIGVCTKFSNAEMLKKDGYSFIEESVGSFLMPTKSDEEFNIILEKTKKSAIPVKACNNFIPGRMKSVGPDAVPDEILKYMETAFRRAQKTGVDCIVFGSGGSRSIPEGFSRDEALKQFTNLCTAMAPIAGKYNVIVVLEPLNKSECNFINSVAEGGEIVEKVNHPNFRLLADIYHMLKEDESPDNILKYGHLLKHTHIAEKERRAAPGTRNEDFRPYFEALKKVDYKGRISIECGWEDMKIQAANAIDAIKKQL